MKIAGSNSCYETREYNISVDIVWQVLNKTILELKYQVLSLKPDYYVITVKNDNVEINFGVQPTTSGSNLIADACTKGFKLFDWGKSQKKVQEFYTALETNINILQTSQPCQQCGAKISSSAKFCEHCGAAQHP